MKDGRKMAFQKGNLKKYHLFFLREVFIGTMRYDAFAVRLETERAEGRGGGRGVPLV